MSSGPSSVQMIAATALGWASTAVGVVVLAYSAKYAFDAWKGNYCFPMNGDYAVTRMFQTVGNDVVNLAVKGGSAVDLFHKPLCPSRPIFVAPSGPMPIEKPGA